VLLALALLVPMIAACGGGAPAPAAEPTAAPAAEPTAAPAAEPTAAPAAEPTAAPAAEPTAAPAAEPTAAPAAAGRGAGGTLRILYWQAPVFLNPHLAVGTKDYDASRLIIEPLAAVGPDGAPVVRLAAEIPTVENGGVAADLTSVTWKLNPDITWSDGSPLTADDVVFTYEYCLDPATACTTNAAFTGATSVEAVDANTVKITWESPNPNPYQMFVGNLGGILQKAQFGTCKGAGAMTDAACQAANLAPIGTGPYKIKEFKPGDVGVYEINENYRNPDQPFFSEVQFKGGGDATSAARAVFQTGDTDYAWNLQVEAAVLQQLIDEGGIGTLLSVKGSSVERIVVNLSNPDPALGEKRSEPDQPHPFLRDQAVRRAIAMAIDRKTIAEQLYGPAGDPTCEIITTLPYVTAEERFGGRSQCVVADGAPDVEGAKKLLDEAGWVDSDGDNIRDKDGVKLVVSYQTTINPLRQRTQAIVKANLAAIGITVNLRAIDASVFFSSDIGNPDTLGKFYADLQMYTNSYDQPDPQNYLNQWISTDPGTSANEWRGSNEGDWVNAEYDAVLEELAKTTDANARIELVRKANDIIINDGGIIPLIARSNITSGYNSKLQGINGSPWDSEMWNIAEWTMAP
jgi:peptide/nickel transport system substrate-binding protein